MIAYIERGHLKDPSLPKDKEKMKHLKKTAIAIAGASLCLSAVPNADAAVIGELGVGFCDVKVEPSHPFLLYHFGDYVFHIKSFVDVLVPQSFTMRLRVLSRLLSSFMTNSRNILN